MNDIDYQAILSSYQQKVSELINQVIIYEAKINSLSNALTELTSKTENQKIIRKKTDSSPSDF